MSEKLNHSHVKMCEKATVLFSMKLRLIQLKQPSMWQAFLTFLTLFIGHLAWYLLLKRTGVLQHLGDYRKFYWESWSKHVETGSSFLVTHILPRNPGSVLDLVISVRGTILRV